MIKNFLVVAFSVFTLFAAPYAYAGHGPKEEPKEEVPAEPEIGYYTIKEITTNLANLNPRDRLHYIQIKVGLMLEDSCYYCRYRTTVEGYYSYYPWKQRILSGCNK